MADTDSAKTPLLQSAFRGETELDLSFCKAVSFVETIDLSGPRLILTFDDTYSIIRNVMKIKVGDVLKCALADMMHENKLNLTADFQIMSMPVDGELVTINCLQKEIADLKKPSVNARLFSNGGGMDVIGILKALTSFKDFDAPDPIALLNPYHLLPGERPSLLLRQLAMEHALVIYAFRGKLCVKTMAAMFGQSLPENVFQYKNPDADYQIVDYKHVNREALIADRVARKYVGFSLTDGILSSGNYGDQPPEITAADSQAVLDNLSKIAIPVLDIITWGAGSIGPGLPMKFQWNMDDKWKDSAIDESLPTSAIVGTVAHYSAGASNYFCRVKAVIQG